MENTYFITGFPGFISRGLIKELLVGDIPVDQLYLLILPIMKEKACNELQSLSVETGIPLNKFTLVQGDITKPNLAISEEFRLTLKKKITHVFHLAAIYDLAVDRRTAELVNVTGTKNVNDWVKKLVNLQRYIYFSTAYVSGKREGRIYEAELVMNQTFKNHYERTKYDAEVLVKQQLSEVPTTIIRPGIVRGHSKTGKTTKFDGPYFMLHLLDRLQKFPFTPYIGKGNVEGNFVPVDYVIHSTIYLSQYREAIGKTYHLTDPAPYKMFEVFGMLSKEYTGKMPTGTIPISLANTGLRFSPIRKWLQVEREALSYFNCHSSYDTRVARKDLRDSNIHCPSFEKTLKTMVNFYREHRDDPEKYIKIH